MYMKLYIDSVVKLKCKCIEMNIELSLTILIYLKVKEKVHNKYHSKQTCLDFIKVLLNKLNLPKVYMACSFSM